jgi:hypothetical protein
MTSFVAANNGSWSTAGTWVQDSGFPNSLSDDATIGGSFEVSITSASYTVNNLSIDGTLDITGGSLVIGYTGPNPNTDIPTTGLLGLGTVNLSSGGLLEVDSGVGSGNSNTAGTEVDFLDGSGDLLVLDAPATSVGATHGAITNFGSFITGMQVGDGVVLKNAVFDGTFTDYTLSENVFGYKVIGSGISGNPIYASNLVLDDSSLGGGQFYTLTDTNIGGTNYLEIIVACFQAGTHLLTERGEVAVEALREGDRMVTFSGRGDVLKPITWIGQRRIDLVTHEYPARARPVRIRAGAFGEAIPHRDLLVSPDHAIYVDGVLIPAKHLINGTTVVQDPGMEEAHYFHIELSEHDVLLAEGLTAESYLDTGNRDVFADVSPLGVPGFADALSA